MPPSKPVPDMIGEVAAIYRYPVKSMRGESRAENDLGWHGLVGDRRLGLRRVDDRSGFPWLTASKLPELVLYEPCRRPASADIPTHVRTPTGDELGVFDGELARAIGSRAGSVVEMTHLSRGIFDVATVSIITSSTVEAISRAAGQPPDVRRFRPNVLIRTSRAFPFEEDGWVGSALSFGEGADAAAIVVTERDERCGMLSLDPDSARPTPEVLRYVARERGNNAGVYATTTRCGALRVGQSVFIGPRITGGANDA